MNVHYPYNDSDGRLGIKKMKLPQFYRVPGSMDMKKAEFIVANKIDLDPDGKIVKDLTEKLNKEVYPISAVTGAGIKELSELLWQKVKELKT